jgi:16S rRNA (guanine966-N2)-methyltransferase
MRIVGGVHRGRALVAPKGHSTRPTADRVRQALFNVLEHAAFAPPLAGARVADLFAGSGALGLEALSRGAAACLFVETDAAALGALAANVRTLREEARSEIRRAHAARLSPRPPQTPRLDLVFLDPPYARGLVSPALDALDAGGWLAPGALVVAETGAAERRPDAPGFTCLDERTWGAARCWFLAAPESA